MECPACGSADIETEETPHFCLDCGEEIPAEGKGEEEESSEKKKNLVCVARIVEAENVAGAKGKKSLTLIRVDVGDGGGGGDDDDDDDEDDGHLLKIVSNASYLEPGRKIVVARVGATVLADGGEMVVKKTVVMGKTSEGVVCDSAMLGWRGGAAGNAIFLPEEGFAPGSAAPASKDEIPAMANKNK